MIENSFIVSIIKCLDDIEQTMANPLYHFQDSMLKCKISVLLLQMSEILLHKIAKRKNGKMQGNRIEKRTLFAQFMKLLSEYVKEEHTVNFSRVPFECHPSISEACSESLFRKKVPIHGFARNW